MVENTPLDYMMWADFASSMAARRAGSGPSCDEVAWLFVARFIKWPVAVSRFQTYATHACDALAERHLSGDTATATAIVESLARVLQDLSGHAFPIMHSRMSAKGRMHSATGIIVHSQWLGLLRKLDGKADARPGHAVLNLGVVEAAYALSPDRKDSIKLVERWIGAILEAWPPSVDTESFEHGRRCDRRLGTATAVDVCGCRRAAALDARGKQSALQRRASEAAEESTASCRISCKALYEVHAVPIRGGARH